MSLIASITTPLVRQYIETYVLIKLPTEEKRDSEKYLEQIKQIILLSQKISFWGAPVKFTAELIFKPNIHEIIPGLYLGGVNCKTETGKWKTSYKEFIKQLEGNGWYLTVYGEKVAKVAKIITCLKAEKLEPEIYKKETLANSSIERIYIPFYPKEKDHYFEKFAAVVSCLDSYEDINLLDKKDWFEGTLQEIDKTLQEKQNVLVHCRGGVTRSATVVIIYLMKRYGLPFQKAFDYVQFRRPVIRLNPKLIEGLQQYEPYCLQ